jgi:transglutaminase-like putative cysteine protease
MRRLNISHITEYQFSAPVSLRPHRLLLRPRESHNVRIESSTLDIIPGHTLQWKRDVLDNSVALVSFTTPTNRLRIASNVVIQHYEDNPFDFLVDDYAVMHPFEYAQEERADLAPFMQAEYPADREAVQHWLGGVDLREPMETFTLLSRLNREISSRFLYEVREQPGVHSPAQTLTRNSGSCRDFAALFMEACRHLGLASRFVSGYLYTSDADADNASTHAWAEVYLPGAGWKGFDATSGVVAGDRHIATAVARHPETVPPVAGSYVGPNDPPPLLSVAVSVTALAA